MASCWPLCPPLLLQPQLLMSQEGWAQCIRLSLPNIPSASVVTVYLQHKWDICKTSPFLCCSTAQGHLRWLTMNCSMFSFCWLAVFRRSAVLSRSFSCLDTWARRSRSSLSIDSSWGRRTSSQTTVWRPNVSSSLWFLPIRSRTPIFSADWVPFIITSQSLSSEQLRKRPQVGMLRTWKPPIKDQGDPDSRPTATPNCEQDLQISPWSSFVSPFSHPCRTWNFRDTMSGTQGYLMTVFTFQNVCTNLKMVKCFLVISIVFSPNIPVTLIWK